MVVESLLKVLLSLDCKYSLCVLHLYGAIITIYKLIYNIIPGMFLEAHKMSVVSSLSWRSDNEIVSAGHDSIVQLWNISF